MENASKALIIAGAILISIVLISIGILVVNSADNLVSGAGEQMSAQEIQLFNRQFDTYLGTQKGSAIRTLMGTVSSSNATHDEAHQVAVEGPNGETTPDAIRTAVRPTSNYTVEIITNAESALTEMIKITAATAGTTTTSR